VLVFVRRANGVVAQPIDVLADDGTRVYVADGIDSGAMVAVTGVGALKALWLSAGREGG
jgi:hypothetical protein